MSNKPRVRISGRLLFIERDPLEIIRYAHALNPREFENAFKKVGLSITTQDDIIALANLAVSGQDVKGYRGADGKIHAFNTMEIVRTIPVSKEFVINQGNAIEFYDMVVDGEKVKII